MKLYGVSLSPFFERAMIAFDIKGALDKVACAQPPGGIHSEEHYQQNPMGKIPYLVLDDGTVIPEGQVIAEYIDTILDGPSIFPADPLATARAKVICRIYDTHMIRALAPVLMALIWKQPDEAAIKRSIEKDIPKALDDLEAYIDDTGYAVGSGFTIADAAIAPLLFQLKTYFVHYGISGFGDRPKLGKWLEGAGKHPLAERSLARMQRVFDKIAAAEKKAS